MRVLLATNFFPPEHLRGTELSTYWIAQGLQRAGHQTQVICAERWGQGKEHWNGWADEHYQGIAVRRLFINWTRAADPFRYLYDNPAVQRHVEHLLTESGPDLVHITSCQTLSASVIYAAKAIGLPVVLTLTDYWFICPRVALLHANGTACSGHIVAEECIRCLAWDAKAYRWPQKLLSERFVLALLKGIARLRWISRLRGFRGMVGDVNGRRTFLTGALHACSLIIAKSRYVRDFYVSHGAPAGSVIVLPDGKDTSWAALVARNPLVGTLRVGYVGPIENQKGVHTLIEAFTRLNGRASLSIWGNLNDDGAYSAHLKRLAAGTPSITFWGGFSQEQLPEVFGRMDVLVVPSIVPETFGQVVREAFTAKIPVVCSAIGALPEAVTDGVNGLLFEPGDAEGLRCRLQRLVDQPGELRRLEAGIGRVRTIEEHVAELLDIYDRVLGRHSS